MKHLLAVALGAMLVAGCRDALTPSSPPDPANDVDVSLNAATVSSGAAAATFTYRCNNNTCFFDARGSNPPGGVSSYNWTLGDGYAAGAPSLGHDYRGGRYTVSLLIVSRTGGRYRTSASIVTSGSSGTAGGASGSTASGGSTGASGGNASAPASSGTDDKPAPSTGSSSASFTYRCSNNVCFFDGRASAPPGGVGSYNWYLGDGAEAGTPALGHDYRGGQYTVKLLIVGKRGGRYTASASIRTSGSSGTAGGASSAPAGGVSGGTADEAGGRDGDAAGDPAAPSSPPQSAPPPPPTQSAPPPPAIGGSHQPSGMSTVLDWSGSSEAPWRHSFLGSFRFTADSGLRATYGPWNMSAGSSNCPGTVSCSGNPGHLYIRLPSGTHSAYLAFDVWVSPGWVQNGSGVNKLFEFAIAEHTALIPGLHGSSNALHLAIGSDVTADVNYSQCFIGQSASDCKRFPWGPSFVSTGRWHRAEYLVVTNQRDAQEGRAIIWLDGVLQQDIRDLRGSSGGGASISQLDMNQIWGGRGGVLSAPQNLYIRNVRVATSSAYLR